MRLCIIMILSRKKQAGISSHQIKISRCGATGISFEIVEQLGWQCPDFVAVSVGDGCIITGVWKGFRDMYAVGLIDRLPRLLSVQAEGCCPINRAFAGNAPIVWMSEYTLADSIAVGIPRNADKALAAIKESNGICINVSDDEILAVMRLLGKHAGVFGEPAGVAGTAGLVKAVQHSMIPRDALVVSIVTGNGLKDIASAQKAAGMESRQNGNKNGASHLICIEPDMELLEKELGNP